MSAIPATQMRAFVPFYKVCTPYETTRNPFKVIDFCSRSGNPDLTGDSSREAPFRRKGAGSAPAFDIQVAKTGERGPISPFIWNRFGQRGHCRNTSYDCVVVTVLCSRLCKARCYTCSYIESASEIKYRTVQYCQLESFFTEHPFSLRPPVDTIGNNSWLQPNIAVNLFSGGSDRCFDQNPARGPNV